MCSGPLKVALVTGAASGLGRACADALAKEGAARVVRLDVRDGPEIRHAAGVEVAIAKLADAPAADFARVLDVQPGVFASWRLGAPVAGFFRPRAQA